jgi:hypothetical protein
LQKQNTNKKDRGVAQGVLGLGFNLQYQEGGGGGEKKKKKMTR